MKLLKLFLISTLCISFEALSIENLPEVTSQFKREGAKLVPYDASGKRQYVPFYQSVGNRLIPYNANGSADLQSDSYRYERGRLQAYAPDGRRR